MKNVHGVFLFKTNTMLRYIYSFLFLFSFVVNAGFCHKLGDTVSVLTKSVSPLNQPFVTYSEESVFPFCQKNMNKTPQLSFTQVFNTHPIQKSFYKIQFLGKNYKTKKKHFH
jgi:hypothetical protein